MRVIRGFTLIELMVGLAIGLISTLSITQVLLLSEGQKRTTMSGTDAQISGALALASLRQNIEMAGYGFSSSPDSIGCQIEGKFNGSDPWSGSGFPSAPILIPAVITDGANGAPDSIRVLSSSKTSYSIPVRVIAPGYDATNSSFNTAFPVTSVRGIAKNDLILAVTNSTTNCQLFQVTAESGAASEVARVDDSSKWNAVGYPDKTYSDGQYLINMGSINDTIFSVSSAGALQSNRLTLGANYAPIYTGATDIFDHIVNLQALYGKDTDGNGTVDTWDNVTPTTNAGWLQVLAIRIAVVSQSSQYEKTSSNNVNVTETNPLWDVGSDSTITGAATCGSSKCLTLKVDGLTDWKHYRYKVYDTIIPLRNMLWQS